MLRAGDVVVAGVSGGADSVCLLFMLREMRKKIPFTLLAAHVNHGIREEAGEDARFVQALCERLDVPFFVENADIRKLAGQQGCSEEEAGRRARYEFFGRILREWENGGRRRIAVAHNLNDRAETMLFHLFRGSGLKGLGSIRPVREGGEGPDVIRPLLGVSRSEIEEYLTGIGEKWCIDRTNEEDTYTRNRIRHHILPYAEEAVAEGAVAHMGRAADILSEAADYAEQEAEKAYRRCVLSESGNGMRLSVEEVLKLHVFLQKQLILACLERLTPARRDITAEHVEAARALFTEEGNREIYLPRNLKAVREYGTVRFEASGGEEGLSREAPPERTLPVLREGETVQIRLSDSEILECEAFIYEKTMNIPKNPYTKWFDYDKIREPLVIRTRRTGDYLTISENGDRKRLQDYMVNEKIPRGERESILLLAEGAHILWIIGYRISSHYKVDGSTKRILQVRLRGGR